MNQYITKEEKAQEKNISLVESVFKYNERKRLAWALSELYERADKTAIRSYAGLLKGCCESMLIRRYEGAEIETEYAMFCGVRLCPVCAHRRSLKAFAQLSQILDEADRQRIAQSGKPYEYLLITLTMQSVDIDAIDEAIERLTSSVTRLTRTNLWKDAIKGAWRSLEITFNKQSCLYHPHIHLFCAVNPSYFTSAAYISQEKLMKAWRRCGKFPYDPVVDIRRIKTEMRSGAKAEVAKYVTKQIDFLFDLPKTEGAKHLSALHLALQNRKQYISYGVIRSIQRFLNLSDEDGDLINVVEDEKLLNSLRPDVKFVYDIIFFDRWAGAYRKAEFDYNGIKGDARFSSASHFMFDRLMDITGELHPGYKDI